MSDMPDPETMTPGPWVANEAEWHEYDVGTPVKGTCETCGGECGHNFTSFGGQASVKRRELRWTVGNQRTQICDDFRTKADAVLVARAPTLMSIVEALAASDPLEYDDYGSGPCHFCNATEDQIGDGDSFVPHTHTCLWRRATEVLADKNLTHYFRSYARGDW